MLIRKQAGRPVWTVPLEHAEQAGRDVPGTQEARKWVPPVNGGTPYAAPLGVRLRVDLSLLTEDYPGVSRRNSGR